MQYVTEIDSNFKKKKTTFCQDRKMRISNRQNIFFIWSKTSILQSKIYIKTQPFLPQIGLQ